MASRLTALTEDGLKDPGVSSMQMLYNSGQLRGGCRSSWLPTNTAQFASAAPTRGGYEIVDKFARKEIFIEGALAETFKEGGGP